MPADEFANSRNEISLAGSLLPHYGELLRYFRGSVRDAHEAEDLVQGVFERVLSLVRSGQRVDHMRGLLYQTARNLLIDRHRFERVRHHVGDEGLHGVEAPTHDQPEACYAGSQQVRLLVSAIESLPPRCREAFVRHKIDGLPHAAVAAEMQISVNMVERHVMLALATCRKALSR